MFLSLQFSPLKILLWEKGDGICYSICIIKLFCLMSGDGIYVGALTREELRGGEQAGAGPEDSAR